MIEMRKDTCEWNIICEECKKAIKAGKENPVETFRKAGM